jgi:hypothetical protein
MNTTSTSTNTALPTGSTILGSARAGSAARTTTGNRLLGRRIGVLDLREHVVCGLLHLLEGATLADSLHVGDLPCDRGAILRQVVREQGELAEERPADPGDQCDASTTTTTTRRHAMHPDSPYQRDHRESRNVASSASAIGMKTTRAQYRHAMARISPPRTTRRGVPDVIEGLERAHAPLTAP